MMLYEYQLLQSDMGFEEVLTKACANREIPGVVCVANGPNSFNYTKSFGNVSLLDDKPNEPLRPDALFWIASCTKLMTTIACMQCIERKLFTLDEPINRLLPEFNDIQILSGFDPLTEEPILNRNDRAITLRHLLTHSSGISYDHFNPRLTKYLASKGKYPSNGRTGKVAEKYLFPLLFEPGTSFEYGAGIDWAGQMIERATGSSLSSYLELNIWRQLFMTSCTFRPFEDPQKYGRVMEMAERNGLVHPIYGTTLSPDAECVTSKVKHPRDVKVVDDYGGAGCFCSMVDYAKMLNSICLNDGKILSEEMVEEMFTPQLGWGSKERLAKLLSLPEINNSMGGLPQSGEKDSRTLMDWGLGGQMTPIDVEERRRKGTMFWGGLPNLFWWIDRESSVSGVFATQLMPTGDPKCVELVGEFEKAVYDAVDSNRRGKGRGKL